MDTLIRSGNIITASETFTADILIRGEKIAAIGRDLQTGKGVRVIDAKDFNVLPGGVDAHTHFDLPMFGTVSSDNHYSGHKAAAFGGTTTVIDFVSHDFESPLKSVKAWHDRVGGKAAVDYCFHMNITQLTHTVRREIPLLREKGLHSLKVFTAYNNRLRLRDDQIFEVMRIAKDNGMLVLVHAENGDLIELFVKEALENKHKSAEWHAYTRPPITAVEAVYRVIKIAEQAQSPLYIVHMNTKGGVDHVRNARMSGLPVMGETCPQYLFFTEENLKQKDGSKWICSPPMRTPVDNTGVWKSVEDGTMQVIATDHCPFFYNGTKPICYEGKDILIPGKELGKKDFTKIPNGLPGVGDRMLIMWTYGVGKNRITPNQFVAMHCTNPAKIFGLYPQKGAILPGSDADLAIWDPEKEISYGVEAAQHRTDYNLYEGWQLKGGIEKVFLRGEMIVDQGIWLGKKGQGKFIHSHSIQVL